MPAGRCRTHISVKADARLCCRFSALGDGEGPEWVDTSSSAYQAADVRAATRRLPAAKTLAGPLRRIGRNVYGIVVGPPCPETGRSRRETFCRCTSGVGRQLPTSAVVESSWKQAFLPAHRNLRTVSGTTIAWDKIAAARATHDHGPAADSTIAAKGAARIDKGVPARNLPRPSPMKGSR
jgi:hypothetical protein